MNERAINILLCTAFRCVIYVFFPVWSTGLKLEENLQMIRLCIGMCLSAHCVTSMMVKAFYTRGEIRGSTYVKDHCIHVILFFFFFEWLYNCIHFILALTDYVMKRINKCGFPFQVLLDSIFSMNHFLFMQYYTRDLWYFEMSLSALGKFRLILKRTPDLIFSKLCGVFNECFTKWLAWLYCC